MKICQSCVDTRKTKKPSLAPVNQVELPLEITSTFRHPEIRTIVCPYCDGETLVTSALRNHERRMAEREDAS